MFIIQKILFFYLTPPKLTDRVTVSVEVFEERSGDLGSLTAIVNGEGMVWKMNLLPIGDVFGKNFKHLEQKLNGSHVVEEQLDSNDDFVKLISNLYSDEKQGAVVLVEQYNNRVRLVGYLNREIGIQYNNDTGDTEETHKHFVFKIPLKERNFMKAQVNAISNQLTKDNLEERFMNNYWSSSGGPLRPYNIYQTPPFRRYSVLPRYPREYYTHPYGRSPVVYTGGSYTNYNKDGSLKKPVTSKPPEPKISVYYDDAAYQIINKTGLNTITYFTLIFGYTYKRFSEISGYPITLKFTGLTKLPKDMTDKYFDNPCTDVEEAIVNMIEDRKKGNLIFSKADVVVFTTGHKLCTLQEDGSLNEQATGMAVVSGVCSDTENLALVEVLGLFTEAEDFTHELGHSFGSPHDLDNGPPKCAWSLGHIMSYVNANAENKKQFSPCSLAKMKATLESPSKLCVREATETKGVKLNLEEEGKFIKYSRHCKLLFPTFSQYKLFNYLSSLKNDEGKDILCQYTYCMFNVNNTMTRTRIKIPARDGWPCGQKMVCRSRKCVPK